MYSKNTFNVQKQYEWSRKGKTYKTKYFSALSQLFGAIEHDKDCQNRGIEEKETEEAIHGTPGTGQICRVAEEK